MRVSIEWITREEPDLCFKEGFRAFVKQLGRRFENPYPPESLGYDFFLEGWRFAACNLRPKMPSLEVKAIDSALAAASR